MADIAFTETISTVNLYRDRQGVRQKPFVTPKELPYLSRSWHRTYAIAWGTYVAPAVASSNTSGGMTELMNAAVADSVTSTPLSALAYSRLYNKLLSKVGERASLLTALAERQSTYSMVLNRLNQLYKGARALRKGRFREFLVTFGIKAKPKHRNNRWSRPRDFSSLWLEYWFGWAPTIGDINNAIDVWQRPIESISGIRVASGNRQYSRKDTGSNSYYVNDTSCDGSFVMQMRCNITVTNPDLWVANQMGLLNPVRTAWELTPFSWFADWFTNVGQVLGYFTDTLGIQISDIWSTRFSKGTEKRIRYSKAGPGLHGYEMHQDFVFIRRMRHKSLPRPAFILRIPKISWTRGLTLSSLIVQLFSPQPNRTRRA